MEQTYAIVKPHAYRHAFAIRELLRQQGGFRILKERIITLSLEQAEELYAEHQGKPFYEDLLQVMCSGPSLHLLLERENAIEHLRAFIGPTDPLRARQEAPQSIRSVYGDVLPFNAIHASDSRDAVVREVRIVFGVVSGD